MIIIIINVCTFASKVASEPVANAEPDPLAVVRDKAGFLAGVEISLVAISWRCRVGVDGGEEEEEGEDNKFQHGDGGRAYVAKFCPAKR